MSIYRDLNEMRLDVSQYEEESLSDIEQKHWVNRVKNKLGRRSMMAARRWVGFAAVLVLAMGVTLSYGKLTLAKIPATAGQIERFIHSENPPDYSAYKTIIGESAENAYGKLTLNEVLVDSDRLLISSTFEPAKGVDFNYQTQLRPSVLVNGEDLQLTRGSQSVRVVEGMYTVYGDINVGELPRDGRPLQLAITYDRIIGSGEHEITGKPIEEPWVFHVEVSTSELNAAITAIELNETIPLLHGEAVTIDSAILSPISTLIYFDAAEASDSLRLKLVSDSGQEILESEGYISDEPGERSYIRFRSIDVGQESYRIVPIGFDDRQELGQGVQIP
ncbi:DUF4179 domain-containing protein [Paenibacillus sp. 1011MAR3C5]|uniref:DUF4179 domain-containing protein n=1 Tax=Paenibacillus sp. 1011MAR3C5 TaxID=1675787 RepID=UPI000E6D4C7C|nr:DUF4179 domain-containing protein [Paenibacillus sp. 1011MAR3C5]RJE83949.1 DUF4179 domain-containing protein [Paenibacillus sp. 1011MAR3C5]